MQVPTSLVNQGPFERRCIGRQARSKHPLRQGTHIRLLVRKNGIKTPDLPRRTSKTDNYDRLQHLQDIAALETVALIDRATELQWRPEERLSRPEGRPVRSVQIVPQVRR